jgi:ectoine hydroxylase-related dioxygenase (phytanoyl-CoA dioxygenase family)
MDHLDHFHTHGYAVVRGVFGADDVAALRQAFDRIYARGLSYGRSYRHQNVLFRITPDARLGRIVRMVQWPAYFDPLLDKVRLDRRLFDLVSPLVGSDLKQIINQMHWKPPGAEMVEFGYHQDYHFRRPKEAYRALEASYVQTGIAVDHHRVENGAMTVYPGSHLQGPLVFPERGRIANASVSDDDLRGLGLDPQAMVPVEMEPGDVALWHVCTIHGSGPNTTAEDRRLYINGFVTGANCDRGEWAFREGRACKLGEPVLVHYDDLFSRPEPHYVDA